MTQLDRVIRHNLGYKFKDEWVSTTNRYGEATSFKKYILDKEGVVND